MSLPVGVSSLGDEDEDSRSGHSEDESTADEDDSAMQRRRPDCAIITTTNDVGGATDTLGMVGNYANDINYPGLRIIICVTRFRK